MELTEKNITILKELGFSCDGDKTGNELDEDWWSLDDGWGFRLDAVEDFPTLMKRLQLAEYEYLVCHTGRIEPVSREDLIHGELADDLSVID